MTAASVITGVLLATFGMVYQTGADSYQLFFSWAVLIFPWVIAARFQPLWLIWLLLANLAVLRWVFVTQSVFFAEENFNYQLILIGFVINSILLVLREFTDLIHPDRTTGRWFPQLLAIVLLAGLTYVPVEAVTEQIGGNLWWVLLVLYLVTLGTCLFFYAYTRRDLVMLTFVMLSMMLVLTTGFFHHAFNSVFDFEMLFPAGMFIIFETAAAAALLMRINKQWQLEGRHS